MQTWEELLDKRVCETVVEIKNANGLHLRPAMLFVDVASQFGSDIRVSDAQQNVDGKSIMQVSLLAATVGMKLKIRAEGADADKAVAALQNLVEVEMFSEAPGSVSK